MSVKGRNPARNSTQCSYKGECPLCRGLGRPWGEKGGVPLRLCECNHGAVLLAWAWDSDTEYENYYRGLTYHREAHIAQGLPPQYERFEEHRCAARCRLTWLRDNNVLNGAKPFKLLDVGSGNGALVAEAQSWGYPATGIEPSEAMCQWVWREHGIALHCGVWEEMSGEWDLITATDVIEHLTDPAGFLQRCGQHADRLYMETPSWHPDLPDDWKHIRPREHLCLFSETALLELTSSSGWDAIETYSPIPGKSGVLLSRRAPLETNS